MAAKLSLKIWGVRGGDPHWHENKGSVVAHVGNDNYVAVDAFEGYGDTYKRREECQIQVNNGDYTWTGTLDELTAILKEKQTK